MRFAKKIENLRKHLIKRINERFDSGEFEVKLDKMKDGDMLTFIIKAKMMMVDDDFYKIT